MPDHPENYPARCIQCKAAGPGHFYWCGQASPQNSLVETFGKSLEACRNGRCRNEARYYIFDGSFWTSLPRFCGVCDILVNKGEGRLFRELPGNL